MRERRAMNGTHQAAPTRNGVFVPGRVLVLASAAIVVLVGLQAKALYDVMQKTEGSVVTASLSPAGGSSYQGVHMQNDAVASTFCRWYLAESAIPDGGLGVYTAFGLHKNQMVGFPDICLFVADAPSKWTQLHSHSFGGGTFFGQYEGNNSRAACEGFTTLYNTAPKAMINTELVSPVIQTNAGLHRATSPGAGAITHHYGISGKALNLITAGSELTVDYGDWDFDKDMSFVKPQRKVSWLQENGWCIDNIEIKPSTIPNAGRGSFARRPIYKNDTVAPAPLQVFKNRKAFQSTMPEQLFVNYCLQPADSTMMVFPYGPAVNLINHAPKPKANVEWRWSTQTKSNRHHPEWLDLPLNKFWDEAYPGGLILEVAATRDIAVGEELFVDYGSAWEDAWAQHENEWRPPAHSSEYVYPAELDETAPVRTVTEQKTNPYASNIGTLCATAEWEREDRKQRLKWTEPTQWNWWEAFTCCHILSRKFNARLGEDFYKVALVFDNKPSDFTYDGKNSKMTQYIETEVPRRAIRFIEIPYMDDEHMDGAFRHPLELPEHLVPMAWKTLAN